MLGFYIFLFQIKISINKQKTKIMAVMKKFEASSASVQVNGETTLSFIKAVPTSESSRKDILKKHGIDNPQPGQWYPQQAWLNAFKEMSEKVAVVTLRLIGKAIPKNAKFPPEIKDIKQTFETLDKAYKMNHKGGHWRVQISFFWCSKERNKNGD